MTSIKQSVRHELYRDISIHLLEQLERNGLLPTILSEDQKSVINELVNETIDSIGETIAEQSFTVNNEFMPPEHTLYGLDGEPLCTTECLCDRCLDYFSNQ